MRNQDLRLARHSIESNIDLTISLLARVRDDGALDGAAREEAARILAALEPLIADRDLTEAARRDAVADVEGDLVRLDEAVNGPLPSEAG
jgi:hypothetical protein